MAQFDIDKSALSVLEWSALVVQGYYYYEQDGQWRFITVACGINGGLFVLTMP